MAIEVVDVILFADSGGAAAFDVETVDPNIVDNIEVKGNVTITDLVDATDDVEANEIVGDIVEEPNTVVPVAITVTAFAVDSFAIEAIAANRSITADTTRMFNKISAPATQSCFTLHS
ncbi:MAG TPA: hypothetical protein VK503_01685 [Candidatus Bathyarchaeia archaeon]|nr:hypothetical protein [Candidatus Bathyarchaeia archaeon]